MKAILIIILTAITFLSCDSKKTSISGTVLLKTTGEPVAGALVSYLQCKENGDNCTEIIIGQMYTLEDGSFKIDQKRANKSKTRWITVYSGNKKIAQQDNISLVDKNITIEATP
jgi:hypothetical protein